MIIYMFYNFWIYLCCLATISPFVAYTKSKILKKISVQQDIIIISLSLVIIYVITQLLMNKDVIPTDIDNTTIKYLILNISLISMSLYIGGVILTRENVFKFKSLQKPVYLIILVIIASCVYKEELNYKIFIGIILLVIGSYLIDNNININLKY